MSGDMHLNIRRAETDDLDRIMTVYRAAQGAMIASGNPTQWGYSYPTRQIINDDIQKHRCYLLCDGTGIRGAFVLCEGEDPTYLHIENGSWLGDGEYVTIHRLASDGKARGIFESAFEYCRTCADSIRIDTHRDNLKMQALLERFGFTRCGTIRTHDGTQRIAYQWIKK